MDIIDQIEEDLNEALKAGEKVKASVLRLALNAIRNAKIEKQDELAEEDVVKVLQKQVKERDESIEAFEEGDREEQAEEEKQAKEILEDYLPEMMSADEIREKVKEVIEEVGDDFGQVMGKVMDEIGARADGNQVSDIVNEELNE